MVVAQQQQQFYDMSLVRIVPLRSNKVSSAYSLETDGGPISCAVAYSKLVTSAEFASLVHEQVLKCAPYENFSVELPGYSRLNPDRAFTVTVHYEPNVWCAVPEASGGKSVVKVQSAEADPNKVMVKPLLLGEDEEVYCNLGAFFRHALQGQVVAFLQAVARQCAQYVERSPVFVTCQGSAQHPIMACLYRNPMLYRAPARELAAYRASRTLADAAGAGGAAGAPAAAQGKRRRKRKKPVFSRVI